MTEDVTERLNDLEQQITAVADTQQAIRESSIKPRLEKLQEDSDDARSERAELQEEIRDLRATVAELRSTLEAIAGLADDEASNPDKRAADLAHTLIRRARSRDGTAAMYYQEVQDSLETLGHGDLKPPQLYDAMEHVAALHGFSETKTTSAEGNRVDAVAVNLDELTAAEGVKEIKSQDRPTTAESVVQEVSKETS